MLRQPPLQVRRVTDVKPIVLRGMQQVDVKHVLSFYRDSRVGRSLFTRIRALRVQRIRHHLRLTADPMIFLRAISYPAVSPRRSFSAKMGALPKEDVPCGARTSAR